MSSLLFLTLNLFAFDRPTNVASLRCAPLAGKHLEGIYELRSPLNRNAFLYGCLDLTEDEAIEHRGECVAYVESERAIELNRPSNISDKGHRDKVFCVHHWIASPLLSTSAKVRRVS